MKRLFLKLLGATVLTGAGFAGHTQVSQYVFSRDTVSYTPVTGTVLASATANDDAGSLDDAIYPITGFPFTFTFNGVGYTSCNVSTNGFVTFGATSPAADNYTPISSTATYEGAVSAFGGDLQSFFNVGGRTGNISFSFEGTAPNREVVIQWTDFRPAYVSTYTNVYGMNYQIRLQETSNNVQVVYGPGSFALGSTAISATRQIGLRGASASDFNNRLNATTVLFGNSTPGTAASSTQAFNTTTTPPGPPPSGLRYTYAPPPPCVAPSTQPTALTTTSVTPTTLAVSFTAAAGGATNYLVVRTPNTPLTTTPTNGTTYAVGSALGNGTVVANGTGTTFTQSGLTPNTTYTYTVFAFNGTGCLGGNTYNTTSPLTGSLSTLAATAYTWIPTSGVADFRVASNWSPVRTTPDATDTLYFTNGGTPQADSITSQTVAKVGIGNNTALSTTTAAAATLTIGRTYDLQAGSSHTLLGTFAQTITHSSVNAPQSSSIAGTLNLRVTGTAASVFNAVNSITTVSGTVNVDSNGGAFTATQTNTFFTATGVNNHRRNGGTLANATYDAAANTNVLGIVGTAPTVTSLGRFGNLTWNSPNQTVAASLASGLDTIRGDFNIISTGTGSLTPGNTVDIQVMGSFNLTGGTFFINNFTSASLIEVFGATNLSGGTLNFTSSTTTTAIINFRTFGNLTQAAGNTIAQNGAVGASPRFEFAGATQQTASFGGTINNDIDLVLNNPAGLVLATNFPVNANAQVIVTRGAFSGSGSLTYAATLTSLQYNGTTPQTPTAVEFPATGGPATLVINNATGVTLPFARTITNLTLTNGRLFTSATNLLTLTTTTSATGSATSYVVGPLGYSVNSATDVSRTFPIGDLGGFRPLTLTAFNTGGTTQTVTAQSIAGNSGGSGAGLTLNPVRYYRITGLSNLTLGATSSVTLSYGSDDVVSPIASAVVAQSTTPSGTYTSLGQGTNTASTVVSPATASILTAAGGEYFVIANTASSVKFWDGGAGTGNWGDAANWNNDVLPSCADTVFISFGGPLTVTLAPSSLSQVLTLANGVTLSAPAGTTLSVGCATPQGGNKTLTFLSGSTLNLTAGTVNVYGPAVFNSGSTFNQSGGLLLLDGNDNTSAGTTSVTGSLLQFVGGSTINATAGTIRIVDPLPITNTSTGNYVITANVATSSTAYFSGTHTIELGDGTSTSLGSANGFRVYNFPGAGYAPFNNLTVNGGSGFGRWMTNALSLPVSGTLTINAGSSVRSSATALTIGGTLVNNGLLANTVVLGLGAVGTSYTSNSAASVGGSGIFRNTIPTASVTAAGTGYAVGDVLTLTGGTSTTPATFVVTAITVGTGAITSVAVFDMGDYSVAPTGANATTTNGTGTGATLTPGTGTGALIPTANLTSMTVNVTAPGTGTINRPLSMSGTLTMTTGLLNTTSTNLLSLIAGASVSGVSNTSFVNGPISKAGTTAFTFPVGKAGTGYQPIGISAPATAATFRAEYIRSSGSALGPITAPGIVQVSECEYWTLDRTAGTASADVTLNWNANSPCGPNGQAGYINTVADIRAVHFNGTTWDASGGTPTGTATTGSVTWTGVSVFSPFTLGSVSAANPLPLALTDISATNEGASNRVTWTSAQEKTGLRYELQRSADGRNFLTIETREGSGDGTSYLHYDTKPLAGKNHYRVRAVDASGAVVVSKVVTAYAGFVASTFALQTFPNPVSNTLTVTMDGQAEGRASLTLTDATGKVLHVQAFTGSQAVIGMSSFPAGLYFVRYSDSARTETIKVTKH